MDGMHTYMDLFFDDLKASQSDRENQIPIHLKAIHPRYLTLTAFARKAGGDGGSGCQVGGTCEAGGENKIASRLHVVML